MCLNIKHFMLLSIQLSMFRTTISANTYSPSPLSHSDFSRTFVAKVKDVLKIVFTPIPYGTPPLPAPLHPLNPSVLSRWPCRLLDAG